MTIDIIISFLMILMIIAAMVAVEMKDLLSSVVGIGAVGVILALVFLLLQAPDLAIVQLVVEILALIILIRATVTRDSVYYRRREIFVKTVTLIGVIIFLISLYSIVKLLPPFGEPKLKVASYYITEGQGIKNAISETGAANIVASVILDYRAYDTLGEATVLFTAVLGVLAVMRKIGRKKDETKK